MSTSADQYEAVRIVREIEAPAEQVYDAWVNPEQLIRWIGPEKFEVTRAEVDPQVGGAAQIWGNQESAETGIFNWDFIEMVPPERLVLSFAFANREQDPDAHRSLLTLEIREQSPGVTALVLVHERLNPDAHDNAANVTTGWGKVLGRLVTHLESPPEE